MQDKVKLVKNLEDLSQQVIDNFNRNSTKEVDNSEPIRDNEFSPVINELYDISSDLGRSINTIEENLKTILKLIG